MIELAILSLDFMSFTNDKKYYNQKQGLLIGSPTSPCFTEIYIQRVEENHVYIVLNAPCLSNRKFDNTFAIISQTWRDIAKQGRIQRFWKGVALYIDNHGWPSKKILGFRWSKKAKNNVRNCTFLAKYFQHFQIFSVFICNKRLPMKSY